MTQSRMRATMGGSATVFARGGMTHSATCCMLGD
jgi:hypothetical protein